MTIDYNELRYQLQQRFEELLEEIAGDVLSADSDTEGIAKMLVDETVDVLLEHDNNERAQELYDDETPEEAYEDHRTLDPGD